MSRSQPSPRRFRGDFRQARWVGVRVRTSGFEVDGELHTRLRGRVVSSSRIRKLFEDGVLACRSGDGVQSEDGVLCEACAHPACRPLLRVQLAHGNLVYLLDLPHSSARNLIRLEDELARLDKSLAATDVLVEVLDRGYWGEVVFHTA